MKVSAGRLCVLRDIKSGMCTRIILMVVSFNVAYAVYNDGMVYHDGSSLPACPQ